MLKKILIGFGLLFGTLVTGAAVFWFGWLTPPESAEVCSNVEQVMDKDGEAFLKSQLEKDARTKGVKLPASLIDQAMNKMKKESEDYCDRFSKKKPMMMGQAIWVKRLKCMRDAEDMGRLEACDEIKTF